MKVIPSNKVIYKFKYDLDYVERISPGEVIEVETNDCFFSTNF